MSSGIRIRHNKAKSGLFIVPLPHKPFPTGPRPMCGACQRAGQVLQHPCKTIHLMLDDAGAVIVSKEIWEDMRRVANHAGFVPANTVIEPPGQTFTPATTRLIIDAVQFGDVPQNGRKQHSTGSGRMTRTDNAVPHLMDVDTYIDKAAQAGIGTDDATNLLLKAKLAEIDGGHNGNNRH